MKPPAPVTTIEAPLHAELGLEDETVAKGATLYNAS